MPLPFRTSTKIRPLEGHAKIAEVHFALDVRIFYLKLMYVTHALYIIVTIAPLRRSLLCWLRVILQ
jgi:hypothetical protein